MNGDILAVEAANTPYDGHHSGAVTPNAAFVEDELVSTSPITPPKARLSTFALNASNLVREDEQSLEISLKRDETVTILGEQTEDRFATLTILYRSSLSCNKTRTGHTYTR